MIVYDVVLLPTKDIADLSIEVSNQLEKDGTKFALNTSDALTHLSLYMANFTPENLAAAISKLAGVAAATPALPLTATAYTHDLEQGMFEITYGNTPAITALQTAIITELNPLRSGLREKDPVGRTLVDYIPQTSGELRTNFDTFGYDEIGSFFRPHITFTRFTEYGHTTDLDILPSVEAFSTTFTTLALCEMGENGTCSRTVATWNLGG